VLSDGSKRCSCGAGCHSFGACLRGKNLHVVGGDAKAHNYEWDHHLDRYEYAVGQGIQPAGTTVEAVETAIAVSQASDVPYRADL
jgi:hypothetical protein